VNTDPALLNTKGCIYAIPSLRTKQKAKALTLAAGCGLGVLLSQLLSVSAGRQSHGVVIAGGGTAALLSLRNSMAAAGRGSVRSGAGDAAKQT
jgi:hypothetical protein